MPTIDLSPYHQPPGTTSDGTKFDNGLDLIQATVNSIDNNNFGAGKIFDPTKIMQNAAANGQALIWNGSNWVPTTPAVSQIFDFTVSGSAAASIDSNTILGGNIPATYNHLRLVVMGRGDNASSNIVTNMRFNNDSGSNYAFEQIAGNAASATASEGASLTAIQIGSLPAASATANHAGIFEAVIPAYAGTVFFKEASSFGGLSQALTTTNIFALVKHGVWASTAAINRITLLPSAGNFLIGTRVTLYGLI